MRKFYILKTVGIFMLLVSIFAFTKPSVAKLNTPDIRVKCLLQTTNYEGEGAYFVVSLINAEGAYEKTLYIQGQDEKWHDTLKEWWKNIGENATHIDEISGATINPGARTIITFNVPLDKLNLGYTIRFESAVEDNTYYKKDLEVALTKKNLKGKYNGKGYIRYIRLMSN